jgi:hypothetical protein
MKAGFVSETIEFGQKSTHSTLWVDHFSQF